MDEANCHSLCGCRVCFRNGVRSPSFKASHDEKQIYCQSNEASATQSCESTTQKSNVLGGLSLKSHRQTVGKTFCSAGPYAYSGGAINYRSRTAEEKVGVLLLNLGGPETLHDVQPFLYNLFADPVCSPHSLS